MEEEKAAPDYSDPPRHDRDGHREGRCARHRQEHRRRGDGLQQLPGRRSGSHGLREKSCRRPRRTGADLIGLSGLDHAQPRRDGPRGQGNAAVGIRAAAVDRRSDHQRQTHGRQDRSAIRQPVVHVVDASRSVGVVDKLLSENLAEISSPRIEALHRQWWPPTNSGKSSWCPIERRSSTVSDRLDDVPIDSPNSLDARPGSAAGGSGALHRLVTVFHGVGTEGKVSQDP